MTKRIATIARGTSLLVIVLIFASLAVASEDKFDSYAGLAYGSKSFSAYPDVDNMTSISVTGLWQPRPLSPTDGTIRGLGIRADLGIFNSGDVYADEGFDAIFADAAFGYELGTSKKFSVFVGAGLGYYAWNSNGPLKDQATFPWIWDLNATIHIGKKALLTVGARGDEGDKPKIDDYEGGGSIDLSGRRLYAALAIEY